MRTLSLVLALCIIISLPTVSAQRVGLSGPVWSSPTLADIDGDPGNGLEIVVGTDKEYMYAIYSNGTEMLKWLIDPPEQLGTGLITGRSSAAIVDLDGDGTKEVLIGGQEAGMGDDTAPGYIWAYYLNGAQMWRHDTGKSSIYSSPVVADINGGSDYEVMIGSNNNMLYVLHGDGSLNWSKSFGGSKVSTVAVGDLTEDGSLEIVVASSDGIVHILRGDGAEITAMQTGGLHISSPALADIDGDGYLEIIIGSTDGSVYAWNGDGTPVGGWPVQAGVISLSSPAVGDLDIDGELEVVVVTDSNDIYAYHGDGTLVDGFPLANQEEPGFIDAVSSPALADLDGDGRLEIILGTSYHSFDATIKGTTNGGNAYAWYINGTLVDGFPKTTGNWIRSSPAVADIDGDGNNEIVMGSDDGGLYIWEVEAAGASWNHGWPMFHYNERNTRMYDAPTAGISSLETGSYYKNPVSFNTTANDVDGYIVSYEWSSSIDGTLGQSPSFETDISLGDHVITLTVLDNDGNVAKAEIGISVVDNLPPTAVILSPSNGSTFLLGENITFAGSGGDPDGEIVAYEWTSDKNGVLGGDDTIIISNLSLGEHVVTLEVVDNGSASGTTSIYLRITEEEDQTTGAGGGGGGGGGGGSGTSFEARIKDVLAGQTFFMEIDDEDIPYLKGLFLTAKQDIYSSEFSVTNLDEKPWQNMEEPDAAVFRYFKVSYDRISYVGGAIFDFRVSKAWLEVNDIDQNTVRMYRYTIKWDELDTEFVKEEDGWVYFKAKTPGFSYFLIGGIKGSGSPSGVSPEERGHDSSIIPAGGWINVPRTSVQSPQTSLPAGETPTGEKKKGICGPTVIVLISIMGLFFSRRVLGT